MSIQVSKESPISSNILYLRDYQNSIKSIDNTSLDVSDQVSEVIYLGELLQGPAERTRFIPIENQNPAFTQKIDNYKRRVQSGIWNFKTTGFSPVFDMVFGISNAVRYSRSRPVFPRDELAEGIALLSLFESQYLLDGVNNAIYPEQFTNHNPDMAYLHLIKGFLEKRIGDFELEKSASL